VIDFCLQGQEQKTRTLSSGVRGEYEWKNPEWGFCSFIFFINFGYILFSNFYLISIDFHLFIFDNGSCSLVEIGNQELFLKKTDWENLIDVRKLLYPG